MMTSVWLRRTLAGGVLTLVATAIVACGSRAVDTAPEPVRRPDIILFLADDHGQWAAGAYGNPDVETPHLDVLADSGVLLSAATTTSPVCSPARASLMTGRLPSQHGIHDFLAERPDQDRDWMDEEITLPELLQLSGYRTALIGKWHLSAWSFDPARGFDRWLSYDQGPEGWPNQYLHDGTVYLSDDGSPVSVDGFQIEHLGRAAREFIDSGDPDQPYFLLFAPTETHEPISGHPEALVARYEGVALAEEISDTVSHLPAANERSMAPENLSPTLAQYYAAVSHQDAELGGLLEHVMARGTLDNTLVIYTSDHGMMVGHRGLIGKANATLPQNLYEESVLIPMILAWSAGFPASGITLDIPFDHLDLFRTILDAAGVVLSAEMEKRIDSPGSSLLPKLRDPDSPWRRYRYAEHGNARMISDGRHKLVRRYEPLHPDFGDELYDLATDPHEAVNVISKPAYQEIEAELGRDLDAYFERFEVSGRSGRTVMEQPPANGMEPWRRLAERLKDVRDPTRPSATPRQGRR